MTDTIIPTFFMQMQSKLIYEHALTIARRHIAPHRGAYVNGGRFGRRDWRIVGENIPESVYEAMKLEIEVS